MCLQDVLYSAGRRLGGGRLMLPQLFFSGLLEIHHAVFERLNLALTCSPVLMFSHAFLDGVVKLSAASARYHLFNRVILIIFTAAVMRWRHPVWIQRPDSVTLLTRIQAVINNENTKELLLRPVGILKSVMWEICILGVLSNNIVVSFCHFYELLWLLLYIRPF